MRDYASLADALGAHDPRWERPFICPAHDDHSASASVNVQKGVWFCYTCGASGKTEGIYYDETLDLRFIDDMLAEPKVLSEEMLGLYRSVHPYWRTRFTDQAIARFQLGYDPVSGRPCYPMRDPQGQLLGIVTRNLDEDGPKYRYPVGVKKNLCLFNYDPMDRPVVILVEGAMDVIACWEAGFIAFGIYGSRLSRCQTQLVECLAPELVVLGMDNDLAGRKCMEEASTLLKTETIKIPWRKWEQYGDDLGELPVDIRRNLLSELVA